MTTGLMGGSSRRGVVLTARDRHLLSELELLRVIDREQAKLFGPFGSTTRANARLLALTQAGYLKRVFVGTITGGRKALYFLPGTNGGLLRQAQKNPLVAEQTVQHQLLINHVYHVLTYVPPPDPQIRMGAWRRFTEPISPTVPLIPDGYVQQSTPTGDVGLFIEADLGTESLSVWGQKVEFYLKLAASGEYHQSFGAGRFLVLVVCESMQRMRSVRRCVCQQTNRIFRFTIQESISSTSAWEPVWHRVTGAEPERLLSRGG